MFPTGRGVDQMAAGTQDTAFGSTGAQALPLWRMPGSMQGSNTLPAPHSLCRPNLQTATLQNSCTAQRGPAGTWLTISKSYSGCGLQAWARTTPLTADRFQKFTIRPVGHMTQRLSDTLACSRSGLDVLVYAFELHPLHFKNRKDSNDRRNPHGAEDDV